MISKTPRPIIYGNINFSQWLYLTPAISITINVYEVGDIIWIKLCPNKKALTARVLGTLTSSAKGDTTGIAKIAKVVQPVNKNPKKLKIINIKNVKTTFGNPLVIMFNPYKIVSDI